MRGRKKKKGEIDEVKKEEKYTALSDSDGKSKGSRTA